MSWIREARRLAVMTHHRSRCQIANLWPWQRTVLAHCLSSSSQETAGTRIPDSGMEHGTMQPGLQSGDQISRLRQSLERPQESASLTQDVPVAPDPSAPRTTPSTPQSPRLEGLTHPTVVSSFQDDYSRKVIWIWCRHGHTGKSSLAGYLRRDPRINACILSGGKKNDMVHFLLGNCHKNCKVVIFDLARTGDEGGTGIHAPCVSLCENILDNNVINYKYETAQLDFYEVPRVLFFANTEPDYSLLSMDRWKVIEIPSYLDKSRTIEEMRTFNFTL